MILTEEEKALLLKLRENGATKEDYKTLTNIAKLIIANRKIAKKKKST